MTRRRRRDPAAPEAKLEMTPMIDVTFLLLIFFMCTIRFVTLEGQLSSELPTDLGLHPGTIVPVDPMRIRIRYDGLADRATFQAGNLTTARRAELLAQVRSFVRRSPPGAPIEIDPTGSVPYRFLVLVMDVCQEADATNIRFGAVPAMVE